MKKLAGIGLAFGAVNVYAATLAWIFTQPPSWLWALILANGSAVATTLWILAVNLLSK